MTQPPDSSNLPAQIADAILAIPKGLTPAAVKALDRLIGASVDLPVAWLSQQKAKIDAQTEAFKLVEASIAKAAASQAGADEATIQRAVDVLVRKAYRKQTNREAVGTAMIEDLRSSTASASANESPAPTAELDDDWLNVFERYAEDASSERMQKLWGRVLAGEVRRPGRFSARTLRFLSEFSQADALMFEEFCKNSFGGAAPKTLVRPADKHDIKDLIDLEASGLVQGASGLGLRRIIHFNKSGHAFLMEGDLTILFKGVPETSFQHEAIVLTPLGQELVSLLPGRDARVAARAVASAVRTPQLEEAFIAQLDGALRLLQPYEVLWLKEVPEPHAPAMTTESLESEAVTAKPLESE